MASSSASAVLLLSHGSRDARAEFVVAQLVCAVARRMGVEVRAAHLDFVGPTPEVALRRLAADGFGHVRVVPLLFTPGYHLRHDVPKAIAASGVIGRLEVSISPALVSDVPQSRRMLLRALVERLDEGTCDLDDIDGVVLAAAGSSSAHARSHVAGLARDLGEELFVPAAAAFVSSRGTRPMAALAALRRHGVRRPAVASLFVAPGHLCDAVARSCTAVPVADPLGVTPGFVDLLVAHASTMTHRPLPV